jgi:hypothetical protein
LELPAKATHHEEARKQESRKLGRETAEDHFSRRGAGGTGNREDHCCPRRQRQRTLLEKIDLESGSPEARKRAMVKDLGGPWTVLLLASWLPDSPLISGLFSLASETTDPCEALLSKTPAAKIYLGQE